MSIPGSDLSHPARVTMPSNRSACMTVSTESAMTSRLTSEARIPSCPIEIPSDTAMVTNSKGNPPAARTPSLARRARRARGRLHGVTSFHEEATPIWGLSQSPSPMPTALSMARAGARVGPSVTSWLRGFIPLSGCSDGSPVRGGSLMGAWYGLPCGYDTAAMPMTGALRAMPLSEP